MISLLRAGDGKPSNVVIRGTSNLGFTLRPQVKIREGRLFRPGTAEIIVGPSISARFRESRDQLHRMQVLFRSGEAGEARAALANREARNCIGDALGGRLAGGLRVELKGEGGEIDGHEVSGAAFRMSGSMIGPILRKSM